MLQHHLPQVICQPWGTRWVRTRATSRSAEPSNPPCLSFPSRALRQARPTSAQGACPCPTLLGHPKRGWGWGWGHPMAWDPPCFPPSRKPLTPGWCRTPGPGWVLPAPLAAQLWPGAVAGWHPPHPGFLLPWDARQRPGPTQHVSTGMSGEPAPWGGPATPAPLKPAPPRGVLAP